MAGKTYKGEVVSDKMDKTIVIAVTRHVQHPVFKKVVKKVARFKVHDEENKCKVGDIVSVTETRPRSKDKRWTVLSILGKA